MKVEITARDGAERSDRVRRYIVDLLERQLKLKPTQKVVRYHKPDGEAYVIAVTVPDHIARAFAKEIAKAAEVQMGWTAKFYDFGGNKQFAVDITE